MVAGKRILILLFWKRKNISTHFSLNSTRLLHTKILLTPHHTLYVWDPLTNNNIQTKSQNIFCQISCTQCAKKVVRPDQALLINKIKYPRVASVNKGSQFSIFIYYPITNLLYISIESKYTTLHSSLFRKKVKRRVPVKFLSQEHGFTYSKLYIQCREIPTERCDLKKKILTWHDKTMRPFVSLHSARISYIFTSLLSSSSPPFSLSLAIIQSLKTSTSQKAHLSS